MQTRDTSIPVFIAINFLLAGLAFAWVALLLCIVIYGVLGSGDPPDEIRDGILGSIILGAPAVVGGVLYAFAGIGMVKRRRWAYYVHLVGACLAGLSCIGLAYTIPALMIAQRPGFLAEFFPEEAASMPTYGFAPVMPGQQQYGGQEYPRQQPQSQYPQQPWR